MFLSSFFPINLYKSLEAFKQTNLKIMRDIKGCIIPGRDETQSNLVWIVLILTNIVWWFPVRRVTFGVENARILLSNVDHLEQLRHAT